MRTGIDKGRRGGGTHRPAPQRLPTARPPARPCAPAGGPQPGTRLVREVVLGLREEPRAAAAALRANTKRCVLLVVDEQTAVADTARWG
jgi:hypothetical protein